MPTAAAVRDNPLHLPTVISRAELRDFGIGEQRVRAQLAANRWSRQGIAILTHNAAPTTRENWLIALIKGTGGWPQTWEFFRNTLLSGGLFTALFVGAMKLTATDESPVEKAAGARDEETNAGETPEEANA